MAEFQRTLERTLQDAASKNRELLSELSRTDYAAPALKQTTDYIANLTSQIAQTDKTLERLGMITADERKDHVKYRDSVVRRYAHKLGGHKGKEKFASKQEKEEREFLEAWQREREAKNHREELLSALKNAESEKQTQEADKGRHEKAQSDLDQLYEAIFSGPTPDAPGEDALEEAVKNASDFFKQCELQSGNENRATEALDKARKWLKTAFANMGDARSASQFDMFGGGTFTDMIERDSLLKAQNNLSQGLRAMEEARSFQPAVPQLTEINIDNGHFLSDVFFDNIFTDYAQHERITNSHAQMSKAVLHLESIRNEQHQRVRNAKSQLNQASSQLDEARKELQAIRSEAFELYAEERSGQFENSEAPPAYEA